MKTLLPVMGVINADGIQYALQYRHLDNNSIVGIHFIDLYFGDKFEQVAYNAGVSYYTGKEVHDKLGYFVNAAYQATEELSLFVEYSSSDFWKAVQNELIAPSAQNVGKINVGNMPRSAISVGAKMQIDKVIAKIALYDINIQSRPYLQIAYTN